MSRLYDYHIHTSLCGHAEGEMEEFVQVAITRGLKEIGFADHLPMYFRSETERDPSIAMTEAQLPMYLAEIQRLNEQYPQMSIKCGIEADYIPGQEQRLAEVLKSYNFDYVLGSIHFLDQWGFDDSRYLSVYEGWSIDDLYTKYFDVLKQAAASGLFDVLAHPDLIKKFGFRPQGNLDTLYDEVVRVISRFDLCVEVNTAGWRYPAGEMYPAVGFLEACYRYQIPVSLGSDAHCPEQVGQDLDKAVQILKGIGYRKVATFHQRRREMVQL